MSARNSKCKRRMRWPRKLLHRGPREMELSSHSRISFDSAEHHEEDTTFPSDKEIIDSNRTEEYDTHLHEKLRNGFSLQSLPDELTTNDGTRGRNAEAVKKLLKHCRNFDGHEWVAPSFTPQVSVYIWDNSARKRISADTSGKANESILEDITFIYRSCMFVWCPLLDTRFDGFVEGLMKVSGEVVMSYDRWIRDEHSFSPNTWGGVLTIYHSQIEAERAATELPERHGFVKALQVSDLLQCLADSELSCSIHGPSTIFLLVENVNFFTDRENLFELRKLFWKFGRVVSCEFNHDSVNGRDAVLYEVEYARATQAFLAATVLDGLPFGTARLTAEIKKTAKERAILKDLPHRLQKFVGRELFPFNFLRGTE